MSYPRPRTAPQLLEEDSELAEWLDRYHDSITQGVVAQIHGTTSEVRKVRAFQLAHFKELQANISEARAAGDRCRTLELLRFYRGFRPIRGHPARGDEGRSNA